MTIKSISELTASEAIAELKAPEVGPGHTRRGLITRLVVIAKLEKPDWQTALQFLEGLAKNGSEEDKNEVRAYLG